MSAPGMRIEDLETLIVASYEQHLLRSGLLTIEQAAEHEYSYAIPQITEGPERPGPNERIKCFRAFAMDQFEFQLNASKDPSAPQAL